MGLFIFRPNVLLSSVGLAGVVGDPPGAGPDLLVSPSGAAAGVRVEAGVVGVDPVPVGADPVLAGAGVATAGIGSGCETEVLGRRWLRFRLKIAPSGVATL